MHRKSIVWVLFIVFALCLFLFQLTIQNATHSVLADGPICQAATVPVALSENQPATYHVTGTLCWEGGLAGKTVQVLAHGFTYDSVYWNFTVPGDNVTYSYMQHLVAAGYATFALDLLGVGASDHPPALDVSIDANAYVICQVVQALRSGAIGGTPFAKVMVVAHSLGSSAAIMEAARYGGIDGLILTGLLHVLAPYGLAEVVASLIPAQFDEKFQHDGLPLGYMTTREGTRAAVFFNTADVDPAVLQQDEVNKDVGTSGEMASFVESLDPLLSLHIQIPVLLAVGQDDALFCAIGLSCSDSSVALAREQLFYSSQTCLEAFVLPGAGHDINLHKNAASWYNVAIDWSNRRVGSSSGQAPTQPCS